MAGEIAELEIRQGIDNTDAAMTLDKLTGTASQGGNDGATLSSFDNGIEHEIEVLSVGNEGLAVEREDEVTIGGETGWTHPTLMVGTQRVHEDIADHIDLVHLGTFTGSDAARTDTCRKQQVGQSVNHQSVNLLGHVDVKRTRASHQMSQAQSVLLGDNSGGHGRGEVVDNDDGMGVVGLEIVFELAHNAPCELVEVVAVDTQEDIRTGHLEVAEECGLERGVVGTSGIYELVTTAFCLLDGANQWGNLDEVGASAGEDANVSHFEFRD